MKEWDIFERGYLDFEAFLSVIATYMKVEQLDQKVEEDYLTICGLTEKEAHQVEVRIARRSSLSLSDPGKYSSERAAREWSTVVDISIHPPSFKLVPLSSPRSPLSKTPKHVIF